MGCSRAIHHYPSGHIFCGALVKLLISLDPRIEKSLHDAYDALARRGELLSTDRLQASYALFRVHLGPDALKSLDGPALLADGSLTGARAQNDLGENREPS